MYVRKSASKTESVINNARQAREERAQQRKKEASVLIIQSAARGFLTRQVAHSI